MTDAPVAAHELLRRARLSQGFTLRQMAKQLNVSYASYRNAEGGQMPVPSVFRTLGQALSPDEASVITTAWLRQWPAQASVADESLLQSTVLPGRTALGGPEVWLTVVEPNETTRDFVSIDRTELHRADRQVAVEFTRLFPYENNRGRTWIGRGSVQPDEELHILFESTNANGDSNGCIMLLPRTLMESRVNYYEGVELRSVDIDGSRILDSRICSMYRPDQLPTRHMPAFAALDLDNTLFNGWSISSWLGGIHAHGLRQLNEVRAAIDRMQTEYLSGTIDHDTYATRAADTYKVLYEANPVDVLRKSAAAFARDAERRKQFFPFAFSVVKTLRERLIAPVLITGAPLELAQEVGKILGISEVYGFDASIASPLQTGSALGKVTVVRNIIGSTGRWLQFAAGDSSSDELVLQNAPLGLIAEALAKLRPGNTGTTAYFTFSESTSERDVVSWLLKELPNLSAPPEVTENFRSN